MNLSAECSTFFCLLNPRFSRNRQFCLFDCPRANNKQSVQSLLTFHLTNISRMQTERQYEITSITDPVNIRSAHAGGAVLVNRYEPRATYELPLYHPLVEEQPQEVYYQEPFLLQQLPSPDDHLPILDDELQQYYQFQYSQMQHQYISQQLHQPQLSFTSVPATLNITNGPVYGTSPLDTQPVIKAKSSRKTHGKSHALARSNVHPYAKLPSAVRKEQKKRGAATAAVGASSSAVAGPSSTYPSSVYDYHWDQRITGPADKTMGLTDKQRTAINLAVVKRRIRAKMIAQGKLSTGEPEASLSPQDMHQPRAILNNNAVMFHDLHHQHQQHQMMLQKQAEEQQAALFLQHILNEEQRRQAYEDVKDIDLSLQDN
ncbi:hypothetical protein DFJ77DRAFT_474968 [Powellomyces hirtus]|nr:hypothetical protein DFJ77DRAFT_474968 [Powellomyces hirtus]